MTDKIPPEILKSLETVTLLMENILADIKDHSTSLAIVKTKLEDLTENVEVLSHVVRDGNGQGSMVTRIALAEKSLEDMEEQINELKDEVNSSLRDMRVAVQ